MTTKKSPNARETAIVQRAVKLMATDPKLRPTAALKQCGLRSDARLRHLRNMLSSHKTTLKAETAKDSRIASRPVGFVSHQVQPARAKVSKQDILQAPVLAKVVKPEVEEVPQPLALMVNAQLQLVNTMLRWSPFGFLIKQNMSNGLAVWNMMMPTRGGE